MAWHRELQVKWVMGVGHRKAKERVAEHKKNRSTCDEEVCEGFVTFNQL